MATSLIPFDEWVAGTLQNSVPANANALRSEALVANVISDSVTAQPSDSSSTDGDCYIIPAAATGAQWSTFAEGSLAYYRGGTWYEFTAYEGLLKVVAGEIKIFNGSAWEVYGGGGPGGSSSITVQEGGVDVALDVTTVNFTGSGVDVTETSPGVVEVNVSGGGGGGGATDNDWLESIQEMRAFHNTSSWNVFGQQTPTVTGAARAQAIDATNAATGLPRVGADVTVASTTAVAGWRVGARQCYVGSSANGGFVFSGGFVIYDGAANSSHRAFVGLYAAGTAPTDVDPSTITSMVGMGYDAADTNVQFFHNDASGTATKIDTGIAKPTTNNSRGYLVKIECPPGGPATFTLKEVVAGSTFTAVASTNLPTATTFLGGLGYAGVGGVSGTIGIALYRQTVKTPAL
jgi:hypothetical protein